MLSRDDTSETGGTHQPQGLMMKSSEGARDRAGRRRSAVFPGSGVRIVARALEPKGGCLVNEAPPAPTNASSIRGRSLKGDTPAHPVTGTGCGSRYWDRFVHPEKVTNWVAKTNKDRPAYPVTGTGCGSRDWDQLVHPVKATIWVATMSPQSCIPEGARYLGPSVHPGGEQAWLAKKNRSPD